MKHCQRMKKLIPLIISLLLCTQAFGQTQRNNEISVSYGLLSNSRLYSMLSTILGPILDPGYKETVFGALSVEYFRDLGELVSVGGTFSYFNLSTVEHEKPNTFNNFSLFPAVKLNWYRRAWFGSYTKIAAGITYRDYFVEKDRVYFNFQVSLLGLEAGPEFLRAYTEIGAGEHGVVVAGLRYRF